MRGPFSVMGIFLKVRGFLETTRFARRKGKAYPRKLSHLLRFLQSGGTAEPFRLSLAGKAELLRK
jgi:hypothetical protein